MHIFDVFCVLCQESNKKIKLKAIIDIIIHRNNESKLWINESNSTILTFQSYTYKWLSSRVHICLSGIINASNFKNKSTSKLTIIIEFHLEKILDVHLRHIWIGREMYLNFTSENNENKMQITVNNVLVVQQIRFKFCIFDGLADWHNNAVL